MLGTMTSVLPKTLICSRSDRLGDLVLTLPAVAFLKKSLADYRIVLHVSAYAADLAELALANGICDGWISSDASLKEENQAWNFAGDTAGLGSADLLAFFHGPMAIKLIQKEKIQFSMAPRTKLSTLWTYSKTIRQRRSQVEKSELDYNVDLARGYLKSRGFGMPEFAGLPKLEIPISWRAGQSTAFQNQAPDVPSKIAAIFVNNGASARNWSLENYLEEGRRLAELGYEIHYHYGGVNADLLKTRLIAATANGKIIDPFPSLKELLIYIAGLQRLVASSTGPLHLGHALGIPVLGVYPGQPRTQSFKRWRPHGYWHNAGVELIEI